VASGMWRYHRELRPYFTWLIKVGRALGLDPIVTSTVRSRGDSPSFQLHPLGAPFMSEALQSISFRVIPNCLDNIGSTT